jgi:16S rRNA C967 or C1407 C5-methylase (RsmB/RsmF family)
MDAASMARSFGEEETEALCESMNRIAPITIRANALKTDAAKLVTGAAGMADRVEIVERMPHTLYLYGPKADCGHAPFRKGLFQVQDEAAQAPPLLLAPATR